MTCDVCHNQIRFNLEPIIVDVQPTKDPDVELVTYMAHQTCHVQPAQFTYNPMTGTYNTGNIFWRPQ